MNATTAAAHTHGNSSDTDYGTYLGSLQQTFLGRTLNGSRPLFQVDGYRLWQAYLATYPEAARQYHTCNACKQFIERFGSLVTIDEDGTTKSALWCAEDAPASDRAAIDAMERLVKGRPAASVFLSNERTWGHPKTGDWRHLSIAPPASLVFKDALLTPGQKMAEKREEVAMVARALDEFSADTIATALRLLRSDALYSSERVLGQAEWLEKLHQQRASTRNTTAQQNLLWLAVAQAPAGFCHPRSSMIGTLLEDIAAGMGFEDVSRRFADKMHPLRYQRPQAAPAAGNIAQAEKTFAALGLAPALPRRLARFDEVPKVWEPRAAAPLYDRERGGVFGNVVPKGTALAASSGMHLPAITMTLQKFVGTVVANAAKIEAELRSGNNPFIAITTAVDPEAPKLFQWDHPFAWYVWHSGASASQYGLTIGWETLSGITRLPARWNDDGQRFKHHGDGIILMMEHARETREAGAALFPSLLRSDLHGVRATIEAHSSKAKMQGLPTGSAIGLDLREGSKTAFPIKLRVTDTQGHKQIYHIDRWD